MTENLFMMEDGTVFLGEKFNENPQQDGDNELLIELSKGQKVIWAAQSRVFKGMVNSPHQLGRVFYFKCATIVRLW